MSADSNDWRFLRNDYPADTISSYLGTLDKGAVGYVFGGPDAVSGSVVADLQSAVG